MCPNHRSFADGPLIAVTTNRVMRYLIKREVFNVPIFAPLMKAAGGIPVEREKSSRDTMQYIFDGLRNGIPHVVFPEGRRNYGPVVGEMHPGAAYMALKAGVDVIPVGIGNSGNVFPKGKKFPRPVKLTFVIGKPIHVEPGQKLERATLNALTELIRERVQLVFDQAEGRALLG